MKRKFNIGLVVIGIFFSLFSFIRYYYGWGLQYGFTDPDKALAYVLIGFLLILVGLNRELSTENCQKIRDNDEAIFKLESYVEDTERRKKKR